MIGGAKTKARAADEGGDALLDSLLGEIEQDPMGGITVNDPWKRAAVSSGAATRPFMPNYRPSTSGAAAVPRLAIGGGGAVFGKPSSLGCTPLQGRAAAAPAAAAAEVVEEEEEAEEVEEEAPSGVSYRSLAEPEY